MSAGARSGEPAGGSPGEAARRTALVTGASSGIGAAIAAALARRGHDLVLVARGEERLRATAASLEAAHGIRARVLPADLVSPGGPEAVARALDEARVDVDALVNAAGFGTYGAFADMDGVEARRLIEVNVSALTDLTRRFLPAMIRRREGRILNVASIAAFAPGPWMAVYHASKAYVLSFSEALAEELRGTGVTVTALCPGPTATGFQARAAAESSPLASWRRPSRAEDVARRGVEGMLRGRRIVFPCLADRVAAALPRLAPRSLVTALVKRARGRSDQPSV